MFALQMSTLTKPPWPEPTCGHNFGPRSRASRRKHFEIKTLAKYSKLLFANKYSNFTIANAVGIPCESILKSIKSMYPENLCTQKIKMHGVAEHMNEIHEFQDARCCRTVESSSREQRFITKPANQMHFARWRQMLAQASAFTLHRFHLGLMRW